MQTNFRVRKARLTIRIIFSAIITRVIWKIYILMSYLVIHKTRHWILKMKRKSQTALRVTCSATNAGSWKFEFERIWLIGSTSLLRTLLWTVFYSHTRSLNRKNLMQLLLVTVYKVHAKESSIISISSTTLSYGERKLGLVSWSCLQWIDSASSLSHITIPLRGQKLLSKLFLVRQVDEIRLIPA